MHDELHTYLDSSFITPQATGPEAGAWAVYTSKVRASLDNETDLMQIYCVSSRRGAEENTVHKFIATCGVTLPGGALKASLSNDEEYALHGDVDFILVRKAPKVSRHSIHT